MNRISIEFLLVPDIHAWLGHGDAMFEKEEKLNYLADPIKQKGKLSSYWTLENLVRFGMAEQIKISNIISELVGKGISMGPESSCC
jgi:hypothetical protein